MRSGAVVAAVLGLVGASLLAVAPASGIGTPGSPIAVGTSPVGVTFDPTGARGYVTISSSNKVVVIDRVTGTLLTPITVGNGPMSIAFLPDGSKAYVANYADDSVTVIDPVTRATLSTIPVGDAPFFIAMSPDGTKAYVPNSASASVSVISTATDTVTATIPVGLAPVAVAFNPAGTRAYVPSGTNVAGGNVVSVINVTTSSILPSIPLAGVPYGAAVSPDGLSLYVSRVNGNKVSIISTATNTVTTTFDVPSKPQGVAFSPNGQQVFIPTYAGSITVIDAATRTLLPSIPSGVDSRIIAFTPDGSRAYVTNNGGGTITVLSLDYSLPTITGTPGAATVGVPYTFTPTIGGTGTTVTLNTGTLPPGLLLASSGQITGTPTTAATYPFTLRVLNGNGSAVQTFTIVVSLPTYAVTFDPAGGTPDPADQTITQGQKAVQPAAPTRAGQVFDGWWNGAVRWNFATDTVTAAVALTAHWLPLPTITGDPAAEAPLDATFSWVPAFTASSGYLVGSTTLPTGLVIDLLTGTISGTPTGSLGTTVVTVQVADHVGVATFDVALTVTHGAASAVRVTPSDATPNQGDTITVAVEAEDAHGNTWDATGAAVITSDVASDVIVGDQVTFPHASPHRLTATVGAASGTALVQVAAAPGILGLTGGTAPLGLGLSALAALLLGGALVVARRRLRADGQN
jgi:YVTN family beta-propeller protein